MIVTFSYALPDELYVEGVSGEVEGTYTYDGPDQIDVDIDQFGNVVGVGYNSPPEPGKMRKTVDPSVHPEVAYIFSDIYIDDFDWQYEYEEELMENGDIYQKVLNPNLKDVYYAKFNASENDWELVQIVKDQTNPQLAKAEKNREYVKRYSDEYSFSDEIETIIADYLETIENYIETLPPIKLWKYTNIDSILALYPVPKIPSTLVLEFSKLPTLEV